MIVAPPPLAAMAAYHQWICWRQVPRGNNKSDKIPTHPVTRAPINPLDPTAWMPYAEAQRSATQSGLGVGFVFTAADPFCFLDIDDCANPNGSNAWQPHAIDVLARFPGAAVEVSCSGRGLHAFFRCSGELRHSKRCAPMRMEFYTSARFVALGTGVVGDSGTDHTAAAQALVAQYFAPTADTSGSWSDGPLPEFTGPTDDDDLIRRASRKQTAAAAFGSSASFEDLWTADSDALAAAYPGGAHRAYDASRADAALASHLAFWTGADCDRISRLMRQSSLRREKWDRDDYIRGTIMLAVNGTSQIYDKIAPTVDVPDANDRFANTIEPVTSYPYLGPAQVVEAFQEYVWVASVDRIVGPSGSLLDASRFNKTLRARIYAMDHSNTKTTDEAWKAFTMSKIADFRHADELTFEPGNPSLTIRRGKQVYANTWRDQEPDLIEGDPTPFLDHIHRILPSENDAPILLAYLAACVQHQGTKFGWAPLIQGVQGNGKSTLASILRHALGGYVHVIGGARLTAQFNGWLSRNVVCVVEDLYIRSDRAESLETIKHILTESYQQIERKGVDQVTERVSCNLLLLTNHQDAIPVNRNERRFGTFFCAQQSVDDLIRDGLDENYFARFYAWLENENGYAIAAHYLHHCEIAYEWNPAKGCRRAPKTSARDTAIAVTMSLEAQLVLDAIDADEPGFRGGWVSSRRAAALLKSQGVMISPQRLRGVMDVLGYGTHPGLTSAGGTRTSRVIPQEGGRPRLFITAGHIAQNITVDVAAAYERAQGYAVSPTIASTAG